MSTDLFMYAMLIALLLAAVLAFLLIKQRIKAKGSPKNDHRPVDVPGKGAQVRQLQLQAYERLILLTDRISIPNLIQRVNQPGLDAREMQSLLTQSIRQEFEHNITQQIYVSAEAWDAVRNLKEQNLLIINQISSFLPEQASGHDLNKHLLDLLMQNPKASLQNVVSEALSYEAKKLM
jgi:hypothetical protein